MSEGVYEPRPLPDWVKVYVSVVIATGVVFVGLSLREIRLHPPGYQWYMLAALTLISGSATVNLPSSGISISVSETFVFFSVLLFGPAAGTIMVALDGLVISFWVARRKPEWYRPLFNMAAPAISLWVAAHVLFALAGTEPLLNRPTPANALVLPLATCALVYFGLNSWLIVFPTATQRGLSPFRVWRESSLLLSLNYLFGAALALLLVVYTRDVDLTFVGVIIPLLLVSYLTYKTTVGRIEDATEHLNQVNRLYLSTVETLAMAIDAKDQVTHGHIRRVQIFAVNLARSVGLKDQNLVKAIEAAALLHDMGKLAVPEYILNKPGRLTPSEFERMKLHASVGADILSAIDFPYPVVPIVRHHHENWDGTGYPDGLRGTDIPIGARILSVVDCFDALTSDRPYRPRLADEEAIRILVERRGAMYDPLIIDTFVRVYREIALPAPETGPSVRALDEIAIARRTIAPTRKDPIFEEIAASADEMQTLYALARSLSGQASVSDAGDVIANHLRRLIPGSLYVFFLLDPTCGELDACHAVGEHADLVHGLRIKLGQRLSGWVAAHRHTISNSDPILDLGDLAKLTPRQLQSCLSAPLQNDDDSVVGVLSIYSTLPNAFSDDHRRIIEAVSKQIAETLKRAADFGAQRHDELTGLFSANQLEKIISDVTRSDRRCTLLLIGVPSATQALASSNLESVRVILRHVVKQAQKCMRPGDSISRYSADGLVVLLNGADEKTARSIAQHLLSSLSEEPAKVSGQLFYVPISIGFAFVPEDGRSLPQLLEAATQQISHGASPSESSIH